MILAVKNLLKQRPILAALPVTLLLLGLWMLWSWWHSPGRVAKSFVAAVSQKDTVAMIALADPSEVKCLGMTPENVRVLLDDAVRSPSGVRLLYLHEENDSHGRVLYDAIIADGSGRALPNVRPHKPGMNGAVAHAVVSVYRSEGHWRVNLSDFIGIIARLRYPDNYQTLFVRHGLPDAYLDQAGSYWMSWEGQKISPEFVRPPSGSSSHEN